MGDLARPNDPHSNSFDGCPACPASWSRVEHDMAMVIDATPAARIQKLRERLAGTGN